jgi:hypothetical protein
VQLACILSQGRPRADLGEIIWAFVAISEDVMIRTVPRRGETQDTESLTKQQKVIGVCLLLFYLAMIGVTIATSKFNIANPSSLTIPPNFN